MNDPAGQLLLAGLLSLGFGLAGWLLPHRWNPLRPGRWLSAKLPERVRLSLPRVLGAMLTVAGIALIASSVVARSMSLQPRSRAPQPASEGETRLETSVTSTTTVRPEPTGIDGFNQYGYTDLMMAVDEGDLERVRRLIAAGADLDLTTEDGWTALHIAINARLETIALVLIEAGANLDLAADRDQLTPLMMAVLYSPSLVEPLLLAGADHEARQWRGATALQLARDEGYPEDSEVILLLTAAAADK